MLSSLHVKLHVYQVNRLIQQHVSCYTMAEKYGPEFRPVCISCMGYIHIPLVSGQQLRNLIIFQHPLKGVNTELFHNL